MELRAIAQMAEPSFVTVSPHNYNSTTVGLAATLQVSAAVPNFLITEYFVNFEPRGHEIAHQIVGDIRPVLGPPPVSFPAWDGAGHQRRADGGLRPAVGWPPGADEAAGRVLALFRRAAIRSGAPAASALERAALWLTHISPILHCLSRRTRLWTWLVPLALAACATLPAERSATPSYALTDTADTTLGRHAERALAGLQGPNGVHLMSRGQDAFLARLVLAETAERSLDAQYFIWHGDVTGQLLIAAFLRAADRGVRVRVLIDDVGSAPNDSRLLLLDRHPNVEVRLFNPLASRSARSVGMMLDFARTNRRMHNKSFTADNKLTIVCGRNIGDEYFEAQSDIDFSDLDALTVGAVVADVSSLFDRYWNSPAAYAIRDLTTVRPDAEAYAAVRAELEAFERSQRGLAYEQALRESALAQQLRDGRVSFTAADVRVLADDAAKIERPEEDRSKNLRPQLLPELGGLRDQLMLISPYFVPGDAGVETLRRLRERGIRVRVLTNSLASTDEIAV